MNESREKVNNKETDQEMINPDVNPPIQGNYFQDDCEKDQEQGETSQIFSGWS